MIRNIIVLIALMIIGVHLYELVWPVIDPRGIVERGSYRGLKVGATKAEVITKLHSWISKSRLDYYLVDGKSYVFPSVDPSIKSYPPLYLSDEWVLVYPSVHKETVVLNFKNDRIVSIKYQRNAMAP